VFIQQIANLVEQLPDTIDSLVESYEDLREDNDFLGSILPEYTLDELGDPDLEETSAPPINVNTILASIVPVLGGIGSFFGSVLANLFLLVTITLYLFANPKIYYRAIIAMVPRHREAFALGIINRIEYAIVAWMRSLVISIFFVGIMTTLVLGVIFQIPNAVAMGVIAGLSGLIPNLGYYIGLIPIVLFTAIHDPVLIIPAVIVYALINEFDGKVIQPRVVQEALAIPAGVVLPFQIISASLFGFFGILLAVPILAIIIILVRRVYVGELLGKQDTITDVEEGADGQYTLVESTADTR
jgi:predicted PurR-regulated permease PerM